MTKTIQQSSDIHTIREILKTHYSSLVYDGSPPFEDFEPDLNSLWFILRQDNDTCGVIKLEYLNFALWVCHIVIHEEYRGKGSEEWGQLVAEKMKHFGATKLLAITPYEAAKKYAEKVGFKQLTVLTKSIKKNGKLLDQHVLELNLTKEQQICWVE